MDPITAFSVAAAAVQFVQFTSQLVQRIAELSEAGSLPAIFNDVRDRLQLAREIISQTSYLRDSLSPEGQQSFDSLIRSCHNHVKCLNDELVGFVVESGDSKLTRYRKACLTILRERKVKAIGKALRDNITFITQLHPVPNQKQVDQCTHHRRASATALPPAALQAIQGHWMVSFARDPGFIGREGILASIETAFKQHYRVSVGGQGGVGKSQVAIEYAYRFRYENPDAHVFWIFGGNESRFYQGYKRIAQKLEIPGWDDPDACAMTLVCERLSTTDEKYLFVLDNADDLESYYPEKYPSSCSDALDLASFIPTQAAGGRVLITSRNYRVAERLMIRGEPIVVKPMDEKEALDLFKSKLRNDTSFDIGSASDLVKVLDCLPLALTQAAAFINANTISAEDYLDALKNDGIEDILDDRLHDSRRDAESVNCIFKSWYLSFRQIEKQYPEAAKFLSLLAMFDRQSIPRTLFKRMKKTALAKHIGCLKDFHMITTHEGSGSINLHRLVHQSIQLTLKKAGTYEQFRDEAISCIAEVHPTVIGVNEWEECEILCPHVDVLVTQEFTTHQARADLAHVLCWAADFDIERGLFDEALARSKQSCEIFRAIVDPHDARLMSSTWMYGRMRYYTATSEADILEAEKLMQVSLQFSDKESLSYAESAFDLCHLYYSLGREEECLNMARTSYKAWEDIEGPKSHRSLDEQHDYALVLASFGHEREAIWNWEDIIRRTPESDATRNIKIVYNLRSLACIAEFKGEAQAAEAMYVKLEKLCSAIYNPQHTHVFDYRLSHAEQVMRQGRYEDAIAYSQAIIDTCQNKSEWRILASAYETIAECRRRQLAFADELTMRAKYLELPTKNLGDTNIESVEARQAMARCLINNGRYIDALDLLEGVLQWREERQGAAHSETLVVIELIGICQDYLGRDAGARDSFVLALTRGEETIFGATASPAQRERLLNNLASALWNLHDWPAVEARCAEIVALADGGGSSSSGSDSEEADEVILGDEEGLDKLAASVEAARKQQLHLKHPHYRHASWMLERSLQQQGKTDESLARHADSAISLLDAVPDTGKQQHEDWSKVRQRPCQPPYDLQETRRFGRIIHPRCWSS